MSRSNNLEIKNPSAKFFSWSGSEGKLKYYDKEAKENIFVDLPFTFLVLDRLTTITGFSDEDKSGIWSNEIYNTKRDVLTVRTTAGIKKQGLYEDVKTVSGAKYAQSVYIAFFDGSELKIGNLKLSGCAVSAWIEFTKGRDIYAGAFKITGAEEDKKGATKFFKPVFEAHPSIKPETENTAKLLDMDLQEYLKAYFALRGQEQVETEQLSGADYIEARDKEINQFPEYSGETAFPDVTEGRGEQLSDDDLPF